MVSRRFRISESFEKNSEAFSKPDVVTEFAEVLGKGKSFNQSFITDSFVYTFINENQDLWKEVFDITELNNKGEMISTPEDTNDFVQIGKKERCDPDTNFNSIFLSNILDKLSDSTIIPYPNFEKELLYRLEGKDVLSDIELMQETVKALVSIVYKEDPENSFRFIFEEYLEHPEIYQRLGGEFQVPGILNGQGGVARLIDAALVTSSFISGIFEFKKLIRVVNKFGGTSANKNELQEFFISYLSGKLDNILLSSSEKTSYFTIIEKTMDFNHKVDLDTLTFPLQFNPLELTPLLSKLINILIRVKIIEWSKNFPIKEEPTVLDLLLELQTELNVNIKQKSSLVSFKEMIENSNHDIIEFTINYFSKKLFHSFLLRATKGGIEKSLLTSFRDLSGIPKGLGNQILSIKECYKLLCPEGWKTQIFQDFILKTASKGLSTATKRTVTERISLLVQNCAKSNTGHSASNTLKIGNKVKSDVIFDSLQQKIPLINSNFQTSDKAEDFLNKSYTIIKSELNKAWLKSILKKGFELYIEQPVTQAWTNEMEDLSRELGRYYRDLMSLERPQLEINELIVESLREALELPSLIDIEKSLKDHEVLILFLKLPEKPQLLNQVSVEDYLTTAFSHSKNIINNLLGRFVDQEIERKTFHQEIEERISLENKVIDWFIRASHSYEEIILESIGLERTADPNDLLLKTLYGGVIYLVEDSLKGMQLESLQKMRKAKFLHDLLFQEITGLKKILTKLNIDYNPETILSYLLEQIDLWNSIFGLKSILTNLDNDNRLQKALTSIKSSNNCTIKKSNGTSVPTLESPGVRSLLGREIVTPWIKRWANSVINVGDSILNEHVNSNDKYQEEEQEQEILSLLFKATGRNDIRNFFVPFIVGHVNNVFDFESCLFPVKYQDYINDVFNEVVSCDSQLAMYFLFKNWMRSREKINIQKDKFRVVEDLDFICYQGNTIQSIKQLLGSPQLNLSDVVKKATGLNLSGLQLKTVLYQLGDSTLFSAASYIENPFEGSQITGLTLELISKEKIPIGIFHPLVENASKSLAGLIERNTLNSSIPDSLYKNVAFQLLEEAELVLLRDSGTLSELTKINSDQEIIGYRDISRTTFKVTTAYLIHFANNKDESLNGYLPEDIEYWGENLSNFSLFIRLINPFFEPGYEIKKRLVNDRILVEKLGLSESDNLEDEMMYPSLIVFDENESFKVVIASYFSSTLKILIAEESKNSNMGIRTIQYLLKTKDFEELIGDFGLIPLPELNRSLPLNKIRVSKEKDGSWTLDHQLIKNISLGAI
jgi:hypothetical protein